MAASNSIWYPTQHSFAGGEVSPRIQVRQDIDAYPQSVLAMTNMFPTLQGSTQRIPGFSFLTEVASGNSEDARIVGFRDIADNPTLAILTGGKATIQPGFGGLGKLSQPATTGQYSLTGSKQNVVSNYDFSLGGKYWNISYRTSNNQGIQQPMVFFHDDESRSYAQIYQYWAYTGFFEYFHATNPMWFEQVVNIPVPTDQSTLRFSGRYTALGTNGVAATWPVTQEILDLTNPEMYYQITDEDNGGVVIFEHVEKVTPVQINEIITFTRSIGFALPLGYTGNLKIRVGTRMNFTPPAYAVEGPTYRLEFHWDQLTIEADTYDLPANASTAMPYTNEELKDVQYVQSPYDPYPLIFVHPHHEPQQLFWDVGGNQYLWGNLLDPAKIPTEWSYNNYPASCTAFQGRLMLGGHGFNAQTIWGSQSGAWHNFEIPTTPAGSDPIKFTSTVRSAIKWLQGHKQLMVGTTELEYTVESESGLLTTADIDIRVNSSHGGINCQPALYGDEVMFASERGSRIRAGSRDFSRVGWTCRDMNLLAPHITAHGIVRIARLRNPHPMLMCVLNNGTLAVLHYDRDMEFHGWSRIIIAGNVLDISVLTNNDGVDIPYIIVQRSIEGVFKLYVEGIPGFVENNRNSIYMDCNLFQSNLTSHIITGLDHLNGKVVQVVTEHGYMGDWTVLGGQIEVIDNTGHPIEFTEAAVGLPQPCGIATLPPIINEQSGGMIAKLRYNEISVRVRDSTAPMFATRNWQNITRPPDRSPGTAMDTVEVLQGIQDVKIANLGWDASQTLSLLEDTPNRVEILAISYKLASKAL